MRASRGSALGFSGVSGTFWRWRATALLFALGGFGCTLITDIDREKIPQPPAPTFPEIDAGQQPMHPVLDAGPLDASLPPQPDAGTDAGLDVADAGDAGAGADAG